MSSAFHTSQLGFDDEKVSRVEDTGETCLEEDD